MSSVPVEVSARRITVPALCPCCSGVADTALAVSFTRLTGERLMRETTREIDFPYCSRCVRHSRWWSAARQVAITILVGGVVAAVAVAIATGIAAAAVVVTGAAGLAALTSLVLQAKARASCCPSCTGPGPAVTYHGWVDHVQRFSFASRRYAAVFAEQNERSLVNVTPHLYQLVEQHRVSTPAPPPARPLQVWPQRGDRGRSLVKEILKIDGRSIMVKPGALLKRGGAMMKRGPMS
jgi:hypothetical protein